MGLATRTTPTTPGHQFEATRRYWAMVFGNRVYKLGYRRQLHGGWKPCVGVLRDPWSREIGYEVSFTANNGTGVGSIY
jgi:hypothetical protein